MLVAVVMHADFQGKQHNIPACLEWEMLPHIIKWSVWDWNLVLKKPELGENKGAGIFHLKIALFHICRLVSFCSSYILHQHVVDQRLSLKFPDTGLEEAKNATEVASLVSGVGDLVAVLFSTSCYLSLLRALTFVTEVAYSHLFLSYQLSLGLS